MSNASGGLLGEMMSSFLDSVIHRERDYDEACKLMGYRRVRAFDCISQDHVTWMITNARIHREGFEAGLHMPVVG